jgi:phage tail-like protein
LLDSQGEAVQFGADNLQKPLGIAATAEAVYVGDNERRRVLTFKKEESYTFAGEAVGYRGPVAALALDGRGNLLVHTGTGLAPLRLSLDKGYRSKGVLWSRPIQLRNYPVNWHRLQARINQLSGGANLRLFVYTSDDEASAPQVNAGSSHPFENEKWRPMLAASAPDEFLNVTDLYIGGAPATYLWIGALFSGEGRATPVMSQLRVEFDHETYLRQLPAIYQGDTPCADFLLRFLSLLETFFGEVEERIGTLSLFFDPMAVPKEFLPWLAGWLALDLDEEWDEQLQRSLIAAAFEMYGRRGTVTGLRDALRLFAGVDAVIEEPVVSAAVWALPAPQASCGCCGCGGARSRDEKLWEAGENSVLGVTTMLAPAEPQGAIAGTTATLDRSHLITDEQFGAPLFEDVAHQFSVQIYQGQLKCADTLARVRAVIEREKPAHTDYHLCIVQPRLRIGFQARVGVDTVIAGPPFSTPLGLGGADVTLGGQPATQMGNESRIGINMRLS